MELHRLALTGAGVVGCTVAVIHGVLIERLMVRPLIRLTTDDRRLSATISRLISPLLHYSTFSWLLGGLALIAAAVWLGPQARLATSLLVGASYLYGVVGNFQATRGRHPGWMLLAVALVLIGFSVSNLTLQELS